jgi:hypothetical protein
MREICTSGSVRGEGGNILTYSAARLSERGEERRKRLGVCQMCMGTEELQLARQVCRRKLREHQPAENSDDPSAISGSMPTVLLICTTLALCVVLPISASAKEPRSTLVRHEFQLTHPCPSTGLTTGRCPGYVKDYIVPPACGGPDVVSNMQWLTIRDAQAYSYCETLRSGSEQFHAELWPNNATRLSRIDWLWSAKRA